MHQTTHYLDKTIALLEFLPEFCERFYMTRQTEISSLTQYNYASRMKIFLQYLQINVTRFDNKPPVDFSLTDMASITVGEANDFVEYLLESGKSGSTAYAYCESVSAYYNFFFKSRLRLADGSFIVDNPFENIKPNKVKKNKPVILDEKEQAALFDTFKYEIKEDSVPDVSLRDLAIVQLILDTGIKVSELVSLDVDDLILSKNSLYVTRNNKDSILSFSSYTAKTLNDYLANRDAMCHPDESQRALFLSTTRGKHLNEDVNNKVRADYDRLTVRSIQRIVKKYAVAAGIPDAEKVTPNSLRESYAIQMLGLSKNPELIKELLGQKDLSHIMEQYINNLNIRR